MSVIKTLGGILINSNLSCDMLNIIAGINASSQDELSQLFNYFKKKHLKFAFWTGFANETTTMQRVLSQIPLPIVEREVGMCAKIAAINLVAANKNLVIKPILY